MARRLASVTDALAYGRKLCGGKFSRVTLYRLLRQKRIVGYAHLNRTTLIDLDSIDRYVKSLPLVDLTEERK